MPSPIPSGTRDPTPAEHHRALIVDSSPELNQLLTNLFDHADWSIQFADDNKEALAMAKAQAFDLTFGNGGLKVPDFGADSAVSPALQAEFKKTTEDLGSDKIALPPSKVHPGLR